MLTLSEGMQNFISNTSQGRVPYWRIVLEPDEIELSEFVFEPGQVTRELIFQDGIYRPGSHNFDIANTKDLGDYLFTLRKNYGNDTWIGKTYRVEYGYREAATPGGSVNGETMILYRGKITSRKEDRINETIDFNSSDDLKAVLDYNIVVTRLASEVFGYDSAVYSDNRSFQTFLLYGTHKLTSLSKTNYLDPKNTLVCRPNLTPSTAKLKPSDTTVHANYNLWFLPLPFGFRIVSPVKTYYWNYIENIWELLSATKSLIVGTGANYISVTDSDTLHGETWAQYKAGTGTYFNNTNNKLQPNLCIELEWADFSEYTSNTTDQNPVLVVYDLLRRYVGIVATTFDASGKIDTVADTYTWNYAYKFFNESQIKINTRYNKETPIFKIVQDIGKLCGFQIFMSSGDTQTLKISIDQTVNPCKDAGIVPFELSTRDSIQSMTVELNTNELYDRVEGSNFQEGISNEQSFDTFFVGSGSKSLQLNSSNNPSVYLYESHSALLAMVQRIYNQFSGLIEKMEIETDLSSIPVELSDYTYIHDHKIGESVLTRITKWAFNLRNKISVTARKYVKLYGPDFTNPVYKVWAFCGCAHAGTNQEVGWGSDASITTGTNIITLNDGNTNNMFPKMIFRIGGTTGGTSGSEYFTIASITDSTHLTTTANASATHTSESWSAGKGYFAR
jgi:hypothetical protein